MNEYPRKHPTDILKENIGTFAVAAVIYYLVNGVVGQNQDGGIIVSTIIMFISAVISASSANFYFRAVHRGRPDINDMYNIFTDNNTLMPLMSIIVAKFLIDAIINTALTVLAFIPVINAVSVIASMIVSMLFIPVYFLFVANPHYETVYYFKASVKYMQGNLLKYIGLVLLHIVPMVMSLVVMIFGLLGRILGLLLELYFMCLLDLYIADFISKIIPDEWYTGTAVF